jgi:UDP-GlcNAc:undecaprenyl-phosphate GlcNAc-1-phosphate transferase
MWLAKRYDAIDYPSGRRVNKRPVPRLGGIAVFVGTMVGVGLTWLIVRVIMGLDIFQPLHHIFRYVNYWGVIAALTVIFVVGLIDDFRGLHPAVKFAGQVVAAIIAVASGVCINRIDLGFINNLGIWTYPITVFYLVAFANIINLIDGLDGLAAGISAISACALALLAILQGGMDAAVLAVSLVGACLAFLAYNFYPAKTFMGDSGSLFMGLMLGIISLLGVMRTSAVISLLVPVAMAGLPVMDTFFSIVRRFKSHTPRTQPDKAHIHHRFIRLLHLSHRQAVLAMYGITAAMSACAVFIAEFDGLIRIIAIVVLAVIVVVIIWYLGLTRLTLAHHYNKRIKKAHKGNKD